VPANKKIVDRVIACGLPTLGGKRSAQFFATSLMLCGSNLMKRLVQSTLATKHGKSFTIAMRLAIHAFVTAAVALAIFIPCFFYAAAAADKTTTIGFSAELEGKEADVREALESVVNDTIVHGTYVYDKEQTLSGAEAVDSSKALGAWTGPGKIYYKVFHNALAPRNFKGSEDQGIITVRYVLQSIAPDRFRIRIDAVFVENEHRTVHPSEGIVESSEFKEIAERLRGIQLQEKKNEQSRARIDAEIAAKQDLLRRRQQEATRFADAEASAQDLVRRVQDLRHKVEMRVSTSGARVKSAPFEGAATLQSLKPSTDVVVLIVSPYWLGIETSDGHRGWIRKEELVALP